MSNEANQQLVIKLFERIAANDANGAADLLTDDCIWKVPGRPDRLALAGPKDKQGITELFKLIAQLMPAGLQIKARDFTCEGDRVAVEAASVGKVVNGREYQNQYHLLIKIRDGKIGQVNEYCDTLNIKETLIDP